MSAPEPRPALPALPVTFRPTRTRVVLLAVGAVVLAVLTAIAVTLETLSAGERVAFVLTGLLFLGVLLMLSRPKVVADAGGVTVVNVTTVRRLEWAEIIRVNLRPGDPWVTLDVADGTTLAAMGIQPGIARQRALHDARVLRDLAETYGTGTPAA